MVRMNDATQQNSPGRRFPDGARLTQWQAADGWPLRHLHVPHAPATAAPRGSILWLGGRGDFIEKYVETLTGWSAQGWVIDSFDWRGQGGSGRLSDNPNVGHVENFAKWIADLAAFYRNWSASTPGPHVVMGHSMGGHLVLRALAEGAILPDAAALIAPMLGFNAPYSDRVGHWVSKAMCRAGNPARAAWKIGEKPGSHASFRQKMLTHDDRRYADEMWWAARDPSLFLGPASWRWVECAYASFLDMARPGTLEAVRTPLLLLSTVADALVDPKAIARAAERLPDARLHQYGADAAHELLREVDAIRDDALARIAGFLDEVAPATGTTA